MSTAQIIIPEIAEQRITAAESALLQRDALLEYAARASTVSDPESAQAAANVLVELKGFSREIESARASAKTKPLQICRDIDAMAKELTVQVERESARISQLVGTWQAEQNRLAEEAKRKAWEEEQRLRREAEEKARIEAERARQEQQALQEKAAKARTEERREILRIQGEEAAKAAAAASAAHVAATEQKIAETRVAAAALIPAKPAGLSTREETCFEITNITALYEAAPYLVRLEPNTAAIKAALKGLSEGQSLPGVKHWKENKAIVR